MNQDLFQKLNKRAVEIRNYVEQQTAFIIPDGIFDMDSVDVHKIYADATNKRNIINAHLKDIDFSLHILNELKLGVSKNTPSGQSKLQQVYAIISTYQTLRKPVEDINNMMYDVLTFFEKVGIHI